MTSQDESYAAEPAPSTRPHTRGLSRQTDGRPAAPVRLVHLGVGNFFRAHAAWYTEHATDAADWGYAAFTGRSPAIAETLAGQDGLYTLLVRGPDGARPEVISSLSAVHAGDDLDALRGYFADPVVAVVTITVTEAGYRRAADGGLDVAAKDVAADIAALREDPAGGVVTTTPGRLTAGLLARRAAMAGRIAIVPNDNVPENGEMAARVVGDLARAVDPVLEAWLAANVSFVTTMVDRITPRTTDDDRAEVARQLGVEDPAVVPTEPFTEWVLAGDFPNGRPDWDSAGAALVDDVRPFEQRKLWLLNGSHSLMAYGASTVGHETVADAIADPEVRSWVEQWWDAAAAHLSLPADDVDRYRQALLDRYSNASIRHLLAQIAADGSQKIPIRAVPVVQAELAAGRVSRGALRLVAAWIAHLRGAGAPVTDAHADQVVPLGAGSVEEATRRTLEWLAIDGGELHDRVVTEVTGLVAGLEARRRR
ncbi:mannitol dehydrogenase family protein [Intrasporangium sp.]|uniref:mannitol dehydrogenase family protein n=1 Tax=Intrasporangium sp. TaxID=1925024 RepID=UPI0033656726